MIGALVAQRRVRSTYAALNARDLDGFLASWSEDATFTFPGDLPASGTWRGKAEIRAWFEDFLDRFPELRFDIRRVCVARPLALGASNDLAVHWQIALTNRDGVSNRNSGITLIELRAGRVVAARDFIASTGDDFRRVWGEAQGGGPPATARGGRSSGATGS
ncbi:MAG TPA: nuclear transport factor 2 family protein, partial [Thermoanaerobaculia bacterium]|nr:nuclear transport factor 2 family protein [Thermoanaerobaculia bacterium]